MAAPITVAALNARGQGFLPGWLGLEVLALEPGRLVSRVTLRPEFLAPNGFLHAATLVALADTSCGYGTLAHLPAGAHNFTTLELKSNFLSTAREGGLRCTARQLHGGRTTQVWDAEVHNELDGKALALFRCTQLLLYPPPA